MRVLSLCASAALAACGTTTETFEATVEYSHTDMSVDHIVLPDALDFCVFEDIENVGTHWQLSHADWECVNQREQTLDAFLRKLRGAWADVLDEVDGHNAQHREPTPVATDAPEPSERAPAWQFWR